MQTHQVQVTQGWHIDLPINVCQDLDIKEGDVLMLSCIFDGKVYKIDSIRGLCVENRIEDFGVKKLKEAGATETEINKLSQTLADGNNIVAYCYNYC